MATIPNKNESVPDNPAMVMGMASFMLLKNVSPPLSPKYTKI